MCVIIAYMLGFHEKRKIRNILYSKPVLVILGLVVLFFLSTVWGAFKKERDTQKIKEQRIEVLESLEEREGILSKEIDRLDTERGVEEEIRAKFEVARGGEGVIVIVNSKDNEEASITPKKKSLWGKMLDIF